MATVLPVKIIILNEAGNRIAVRWTMLPEGAVSPFRFSILESRQLFFEFLHP